MIVPPDAEREKKHKNAEFSNTQDERILHSIFSISLQVSKQYNVVPKFPKHTVI